VKIRRFVAKDMRTALEQIKHELGADAVIMSNKKIPEGVELMAAVDYGQQINNVQDSAKSSNANMSNQIPNRDITEDKVSIGQVVHTKTLQEATKSVQPDSLSALLQRKVQLEQAKIKPNQKTVEDSKQHISTKSAGASEDIEQQLKNFTDRLENGKLAPSQNKQSSQHDSTLQSHSKHHSDTSPQHGTINPSNVEPSVTNTSVELEQMRKEMLSMRQLLEHQVSGLMWQDMAQKNPMKALMVNRLIVMGLNEQVADQVASCISTQKDENQAWQEAKQILSQQLNTTNNEIIHRGGVISLVGPTGVGKTTTIAKLAARFAQIHGADKVVMISTDSYRIAGFEQLSTYGRIIGCQVKLAKDAETLDTLLQQFSDKKLVLIDTAGMGQRDMRLAEHLATLITNSRVRIRNYLVLAANTQQRVMQENVDRFKKVPLAGCIYTKLDESLSVGEIIATSIQNGLSIGYLTDGQRVPEDIKVANIEKLVTLADRLATKVNCQNSWRPLPTSYAVGM